MFCRNCGQQTDETKTGFCISCGLPLGEGIYAPPQDYAFDKSCGLYYQSSTAVDSDNGLTVRRVVWFNPQSGEYNVASYPTEQPSVAVVDPEPEAIPEPEPLPEVIPEPMPEPIPEPIPAAPPPPEPKLQPIQPPVGFVQDIATGLYCRATQTADGWSTTWFDPDTNSYTQQQYPAQQSKPAQAADIGKKSPKSQKSVKVDNFTGKKRKNGAKIVGILLLIFAFILGGGSIAWYFGLLDGVLARFALPASPSAVSSTEGTPAPAQSDSSATADSRTLPIPDNFELVIFPISPTQALFRISGVEISQDFPAKYDDMKDNQVIYEWGVEFGEYSAAIMVTNKNQQNQDSYRITDFSPTVWQREGNNLTSLQGASVKMETEGDVMEMLVTLPSPTPFDFTAGGDYSFIHRYHKKSYTTDTHAVADYAAYQAAIEEGILITRDLP